MISTLERLLAWLQRRELTRKVKWKDCAWSPDGFRQRLSRWTLSKVMYESHATNALASMMYNMASSNIMSREEIDEFWKKNLRKIKQEANDMPWRG